MSTKLKKTFYFFKTINADFQKKNILSDLNTDVKTRFQNLSGTFMEVVWRDLKFVEAILFGWGGNEVVMGMKFLHSLK